MNNEQKHKVVREPARVLNSRLIFKLIYHHTGISRAEIARTTGLTRPTVSDVVASLLEQGLVEEIGRGPSAGGKPPILLSVAEDSRHTIGLDLARGEFHGAVVNLSGKIRNQVDRPLRGRDGQSALLLVYDLVDELLSTASGPLLGIGIGVPGLVNSDEGVVRRAINLDWQDLPLWKLLKERYNLPVYVANDCQAAALAEFAFGKSQDVDNLVLVKVEHGIGAGIVLHGQLYFGDTFGAGEIGHITVANNVKQCRCGNFGCLETVASAKAIVEQAQALAKKDCESFLLQLATSPDDITIEDVCRASEAGDPGVQKLVEAAGRYLGIAVANIIGAFSPRRILIAGSITCFGQRLVDSIQEEMVQRSLAMIARESTVEMSSTGPEIVILGASALVLTRELGLFAST